MNPHVGHQALIEQAIDIADKVTVLLCDSGQDVIPPGLREDILDSTFGNLIELERFRYYEHGLQGGEGSDRDISVKWAEYVDENLPTVDVMVGSEDYVTYMAQVGQFDAFIFDTDRSMNPVSSTEVREGAFEHYMPEAKLQFAQRVYIAGPVSDLKSKVADELGCIDLAYIPTAFNELKQEALSTEDINLCLINTSNKRVIYLPSLVDYVAKLKSMHGYCPSSLLNILEENDMDHSTPPFNIVVVPKDFSDTTYIDVLNKLLPEHQDTIWIRSEDDIPALLEKVKAL